MMMMVMMYHDAQYLDSEEYGDLVRDNHDVVRNVRGAFTPHKLRCV